MKMILFSVLSLFLLSSSMTPVRAQSWAYLGSAKVHGGTDHDEIWVTGAKGDFTAIKLMVENEGIDFDRVVVHFANGGREEMILRNFIPAGGETRVMDLPGRDRIIRKVDFYYKSNAGTKRKGKVSLYGRR